MIVTVALEGFGLGVGLGDEGDLLPPHAANITNSPTHPPDRTRDMTYLLHGHRGARGLPEADVRKTRGGGRQVRSGCRYVSSDVTGEDIRRLISNPFGSKVRA